MPLIERINLFMQVNLLRGIFFFFNFNIFRNIFFWPNERLLYYRIESSVSLFNYQFLYSSYQNTGRTSFLDILVFSSLSAMFVLFACDSSSAPPLCLNFESQKNFLKGIQFQFFLNVLVMICFVTFNAKLLNLSVKKPIRIKYAINMLAISKCYHTFSNILFVLNNLSNRIKESVSQICSLRNQQTLFDDICKSDIRSVRSEDFSCFLYQRRFGIISIIFFALLYCTKPGSE